MTARAKTSGTVSESAHGWALRAGWLTIAIVGILFMVQAVNLAATPLGNEEGFAGTTYADLRATNPQMANAIYHYSMGVAVFIFGTAFLSVVLAVSGLRRGSRYAWLVSLVVGATFLAALALPHVPVGHTEFSHLGVPLILLGVYFVGLVLSASAIFTSRRVGTRAPAEAA